MRRTYVAFSKITFQIFIYEDHPRLQQVINVAELQQRVEEG